jgi:hypothetical protein
VQLLILFDRSRIEGTLSRCCIESPQHFTAGWMWTSWCHPRSEFVAEKKVEPGAEKPGHADFLAGENMRLL